MENKISNIKQLLIDFITGEIDPADKKTVKEWIHQSAENEKYFYHIRDIWESSGAVKKNDSVHTEKSLKRIRKKIHANQPVSTAVFQQIIRIAAVFLLAFALGLLVEYLFSPLNFSNTANQYNITETPRGSKSKIILADGTVVWLNAGSKLTYPVNFSKKERLVELEGEGFFEVKKNERKPFIVQASDIKIKALGTSFNVKAYAEEGTIETTLVEGLVAIQKEMEEEAILLKPNQKATFYKESNTEKVETITKKDETTGTAQLRTEKQNPVQGKVVVDEHVDAVVNTSWKDNQWIIRNKTLGDLAVEIERKYNVSIIINSESLKTFRYTGTIEDEPLEQVLSLISMTSPLKYRIDGKNVIFNEDKQSKERFKNVYNQ